MKRIVFLAFGISISATAMAENPTCTFNNPAGTTRLQILEAGQFVEHSSKTAQAIYSCGPFVNDGSVTLTPATKIMELRSQSCGRADYKNLTYVIYCH